MNAIIRRWGHSQAVRLPKSILEIAGLKENDKVRIVADKEKIIIKHDTGRKHRTLKERISNFKGQYVCEEWDAGKPVGEEVV